LEQYRCTRSFVLSISYTASEYQGSTALPHGQPTFDAYAGANSLVSVTPGWCPDVTSCSSFQSVPQTILVPKGERLASILFYVQGPGNCKPPGSFGCDYQSALTIQIGAAAPHRSSTLLLVHVGVPTSVTNDGIPVGTSASVTATVTAAHGAVDSISFGKGLSSSSTSANVLGPSGLSGFSLARGASRSFTFRVTAKKVGRVILTANVTGTASSGESLTGSGDVTVTLGHVLVALTGRVLRRVFWCPAEGLFAIPGDNSNNVCTSDVVPAAGYTVEATGTTASGAPDTTTGEVDTGGLYEIDVPKGTYTLHVLPSTNPSRATDDGSDVQPMARAIAATGETDHLNFDICGDPKSYDNGHAVDVVIGCTWDELNGRVVDANGSPYEGLTVFGGSDYTTTDAQGRYTLYVVPGEVTLAATTDIRLLKQYRYDVTESTSTDGSVTTAPTLTVKPKLQVVLYRGDATLDGETGALAHPDNNDLDKIELAVQALAVPPAAHSVVTFELHHVGVGGATTCQSAESQETPVSADDQYRYAFYTWTPPDGVLKHGFCPGKYDASVAGDGVNLSTTFRIAAEPGTGTAKS
jgi:hypothetical protein